MTSSNRRSASARKPPPARATIRQIADAAGVHTSTVSRALGAKTAHLVADDVARRIRAVAEDLGYRRNVVAASLRTGRSQLVGVLAPDIADPGFPPILSGLAEVLGENDYAAIVADIGGDGARQGKLIDQLIAQGVDGLVLATVARDDPAVAHCLRARAPAVLVNRVDDAARLPSVLSDDAKGMRLAVDHLVGLSHRRIAHVAGPQQVSTGAARRKGFEAAIARSGSGAAPVACARAYTRDEGRRAALALLTRDRPPTAIVAANDLLALGVYDALATLGLECPRDVSVVGHNDMPYVDLLAPALTTVRIQQREIGREAARMLIAAMSGATLRKKRAVLDCELIIRASTARPPRGD